MQLAIILDELQEALKIDAAHTTQNSPHFWLRKLEAAVQHLVG
jgi:hypothetical protein